MSAQRETWNYRGNCKVWAGKYKNPHNLLHWHYDCELMYVDEGCAEIFCDRRRHTLTAGETLFADSGQVHSIRTCGESAVLTVIVFDRAILRPFLEKLQLASPKPYFPCPVPQLYADLAEVLSDKQTFYEAEAACLAARFMLRLFRRERMVQRLEGDRTEESLKRLLEEMIRRCGDFSFAAAARDMGMSEAYFSRYFKNATGTTFSAYLNRVRTDNAVRLLQSNGGLAMTEIAERCGFPTIRTFNRIFREVTGYAPSQLPEGYVPDDLFLQASSDRFDPTLQDCKLIESFR